VNFQKDPYEKLWRALAEKFQRHIVTSSIFGIRTKGSRAGYYWCSKQNRKVTPQKKTIIENR